MKPADIRFMRLCLEKAAGGAGRVSPNPLVGAAVVRSGRLIASGHHARFGGRHAEVVALRRAGARARGATLYVTLEPCAHHGKTPPCVEAIVASGIRRVVAAMGDPHPLVDGRGFRALRRAGVTVSRGTLAPEARELNEAYVTALREGRPMVTLKAGMSLDGKTATAAGESRWITSEASRRAGHRLRAAHDAILVGIGTALADDPRLSVRGRASGRQPLRVVLDSRLRLPDRARMLRSAGGEVIIYTAGSSRRKGRLEKEGARVIRAGRGRGGVNLGRVLRDLAGRGVHSLLVEGGSEVAWSFLRARLVDRIAFFIAPRILGGRESIPVVGGDGARRLSDGFKVRALRAGLIGGDLLLTGRVGSGRLPRQG